MKLARFKFAGLVALLIVVFAASAFAVGSPSKSRKPTTPDDYARGVAAVKAENYERALGLLGKVVRKNPNNADAWNYIGFSHRKLKRFDRSLESYKKALAIKPNHKGALEYLGELYLQTDQLEKAKAQLKKLDNICTFGCSEYSDLKSAIEAYEARGKSG